MFFKFLLKVLKFIINTLFKILQVIFSSYLLSATYDHDKFEERIEEIDKPVWK